MPALPFALLIVTVIAAAGVTVLAAMQFGFWSLGLVALLAAAAIRLRSWR